jgi:hypothetical protein
MESNYRTDLPSGAPYEERKLLGNSAWLIDSVSVVELGDLELVQARRNFTNATQIVATFNRAVLAERATHPKNYRLDGSLTITRAELIATNVVLLTTRAGTSEDSVLRVEDLVDLQGRGMFQAKSRKVLDVSPRVPSDFSTSATGFEDDFNGAKRDPRWISVGEGPDVFQPSFGVLRVQPATGKNNFLLWNAANADLATQEILMRLRFTTLTPGIPAGGAAAAMSTNTMEGVQAMASSSRFTLAGKNLPAGPEQPSELRLNEWYWLRLKHHFLTNPVAPDALGKIWPADGEAVEPADLEWNYAPASTLRQGLAGIAAGEDASSAFEVDYILIKMPGGPPLDPHFPTAFPVALTIEKVTDRLQLTWRTTDGWELHSRDNLTESQWKVVEEPVEVDPDRGVSTYLIPTGTPQRFFQLRNMSPSQ